MLACNSAVEISYRTELLEQVQEQGLDVLPELIRIVLNPGMQAERSEHLQAARYAHTQECRGYAIPNGHLQDFKIERPRLFYFWIFDG